MFEAPRMSPAAIQMLQTNQQTPVQPVQQGMSMDQVQAMINSLRNQQPQQQYAQNDPMNPNFYQGTG
jgi:hypothetical protein